MRHRRGRVQLLVFVVVFAALIMGSLFTSASATAAPQGGAGVLAPSDTDKPKPPPTPEPSPSPTPEPSPSPSPEPSPSPTPDPDPDPSPPPSPGPTDPPSPAPTSPTSPADPVAGSGVLSGTTREAVPERVEDGPVVETSADAGERDPELVLGLEDRFASASPWIDVVSEIVDDLATVQGDVRSGAGDTTLCIGAGCQRGMRGIDVLVLIASTCVVAGVVTTAAIRSSPRLRLTAAGYLRIASDAATALGHRFAAPFKSRE